MPLEATDKTIICSAGQASPRIGQCWSRVRYSLMGCTFWRTWLTYTGCQMIKYGSKVEFWNFTLIVTMSVQLSFKFWSGFPQNSEFCWKLLPIRPEPCSDVFYFGLPINLDWRCDTRICRSNSELFRNHTNGILYIKSPTTRECSCLIFSATTTT